MDRVDVFKSFRDDTQKEWASRGHIGTDEAIEDHFGLDMRISWPFNFVADVDAEDQIVEEDDETKLVRNGNGALLRWWKDKSGTLDHVDFMVKERAAWDEHMDIVKFKKAYGDKIAFCGGLDIRALESNDQSAVEAKLQKKLPAAMEGSGYILHTDHSVSSRVEYDTYKFFVERGREMGTYSC